ncbi:phosphoglycerate mutase family protein [Metarhizium album ARSEF 1941]|uniref:Phosphoglycerate mutase family protein n=1 Tax=Metarhizium album (strain ARSEF 1941) TaxID=1081103 RepID=A0A0B2WRE4_METAS|nr:phosphoglycerate mutase family protein [Metarhizium album ARSEF 1941]KHN95550.1 phosphoglycerate mutase family protein [Metarhizium album ARSEF 1941]
MHLLLIRHVESVDNAASLYGGSRDAGLTAHGALQAQRLASSLAESRLLVKHIFSSNLERAVKTAHAIRDAQNNAHQSALTVVELAELREKHFGNWEGVKFASGSTQHKPVQTGAETLESLRARCNAFLEQCLAPVMTAQTVEPDNNCVVVVGHGISLGVLTLALVKKLSNGSRYDSTRISWSNTGYADLVISMSSATAVDVPAASSSPWSKLGFRVAQINCTAHLHGLRKTRGGIGSAAHDDKQKTIQGYFVASSRKRKASDVTN